MNSTNQQSETVTSPFNPGNTLAGIEGERNNIHFIFSLLRKSAQALTDYLGMGARETIFERPLWVFLFFSF